MRYITISERTIIEWELKQGTSLRKIALMLNRHHSTIIKEVKTHGGRAKYMAAKASDKAKTNMSNRGVESTMSKHWDLLIFIEDNYDPKICSLALLLKAWKKIHPDAPSLSTLYNWVPKGILKNGYESLLCPRKKALQEIKHWKKMLGRPIDLRSKEQDMSAFGHWEGDLVVGGQTREKGYVLTLVEKITRFAITVKLKTKNPMIVYQ